MWLHSLSTRALEQKPSPDVPVRPSSRSAGRSFPYVGRALSWQLAAFGLLPGRVVAYKSSPDFGVPLGYNWDSLTTEKAIMIVSSCPRCNDPLCVPYGKFPEDAYAQCPWCRETFPLSDVLTSLPPVLEILSADGQPIAAVPQVAAAGAALGDVDFEDLSTADTVVRDDISEGFDLAESEDRILDSTVSNETVTEDTINEESWAEDPTAIQIAEDDFPGIKDAEETWDHEQVAAPVASMKVSPRRPQKKGSAIKTGIMIVLGGLGAFPVAGGILWAIGRPPDLGFWPFDGSGNSSSRSVAAAPAELSSTPLATAQKPAGRSLNSSLGGGSPAGDSGSGAADPADSALAQIMDSADGQDAASVSDDEDFEHLGMNGFGAPDSQVAGQGKKPPAEASMTMPADATIVPSPVDIVDIESGQDPPAADAATLQMPSDLDASPEVTSLDSALDPGLPETDDSSVDASQPAAAEPVDQLSAEAVASITAADQAVESLLNFQGSDKERRGQLGRTYVKVAAACGIVSGDSQAIRALGEKIASSPAVVDQFAFAGSQWLEHPGRSSDGIALVGQLGTSEDGPILTLDSGKEVPLAGDAALPSAAKVLALGRIIDDGSSVQLVLAQPLP